MTREEFESILEEAFMEGYNSAYEEVEEAINEAYEEDDYIDIEGIDESKNVRKQMDKNKTTYVNSDGIATKDVGYRNGSNLDNPKTNIIPAINAGKNWKKLTDQKDNDDDFYNVNSHNPDVFGKTTTARGRIKVADKEDELKTIHRNAIAKLNKIKAERTKNRESYWDHKGNKRRYRNVDPWHKSKMNKYYDDIKD